MEITKRRFTIIILSFFFLCSLGIGIYFLLKQKTNSTIEYSIDKYSEITDWCNINKEDNDLNVNCQGLLLNIRNLGEGNTCLDIRIIAKNKELKDLAICESFSSSAYTNDVLQYKKLMPIEISFSYNQNGALNKYLFNKVSFSRTDNTYIENTVNEDIKNLSEIDPTVTTIQNSVNFCPKPELLPNYITEENKVKYTNFYLQNILSQEEFQDSYIYNIDDSIIRALFACDSMKISGYTGSCMPIEINNSAELVSTIQNLPPTPNWDFDMEEDAITTLKKISLLYDSMELITFYDKTDFTAKVIESTKLYNHSEEIFCATNKLISRLKLDNTVKAYLSYVENIISENVQNIKSAICESTVQKTAGLSVEGLYLSVLSKNMNIQNSTIMNRCYNLNFILNND